MPDYFTYLLVISALLTYLTIPFLTLTSLRQAFTEAIRFRRLPCVSSLGIRRKVIYKLEMSSNPCVIPTQPKDSEGDNRWTSQHNRFVQEGREKDPESEFVSFRPEFCCNIMVLQFYSSEMTSWRAFRSQKSIAASKRCICLTLAYAG